MGSPYYIDTGGSGGSGGSGPKNVPDAPTGDGLIALDSNAEAWRNITQADIVANFAIASFSGISQTVERGASVATPAGTLSYTSGPPDSVNVTNPDGAGSPYTLSSPFTSFNCPDTFSKTGNGNTSTFTAHATKGASTVTATQTITWSDAILFGAEANPVATQGFLDTLQSDGKALHTNRAGTYSFTLTNGKWACIALDAALGTPVLKDSNGFLYTPTLIGTVSWNNSHSVTISMNLYTVGQQGTSTTSFPSYTMS